MQCRKCGKELAYNWVACPFCGTKVVLNRSKTRRANGLGSAYKRGNTWTARITEGFFLENGIKKQKCITKGGFKTKTEALKYCETLYNKAKENATRCPTLSEYWEAFSNGKMQKLGKTTQDAYTFAYRKMESIKARPIDTLSVADLQEVLNAKCPTYEPASDFKTLLNHLFTLAAVEGRVSAEIPKLLEVPKNEEKEILPFTDAEQELLWYSFEAGHINAAIPLIMMYTGMMTGEMRQLEVEMIDFENKQIFGNGLKTATRKKKAILLPDAILPVLEDVTAGKSGLLYPISETAFYREYYAALQEAGITRHLTPYSCRHTKATVMAINENIAPQTLQRIMRWSSTKMMDRYVHPSDQAAREANNTMKRRK